MGPDAASFAGAAASKKHRVPKVIPTKPALFGDLPIIRKVDKTIPEEHLKFLPSISEQFLDQAFQKSKLQDLFNTYLRPTQMGISNAVTGQYTWSQQLAPRLRMP